MSTSTAVPTSTSVSAGPLISSWSHAPHRSIDPITFTSNPNPNPTPIQDRPKMEWRCSVAPEGEGRNHDYSSIINDCCAHIGGTIAGPDHDRPGLCLLFIPEGGNSTHSWRECVGDYSLPNTVHEYALCLPLEEIRDNGAKAPESGAYWNMPKWGTVAAIALYVSIAVVC